ncbi:conserved hypothetical protein [Candidatus Sulfopaludibacter sp. SbA6]|nr:conserved hypothetical protein [Candidatus Sulfopaludibacter sp. SbA6]
MTGLLGSTVLEVAIGIAFIYLLLAVFCTTANEWIATVLKTRGALLQQGILQLLAPDQSAPSGAAQDAIVTRFYNHPLIKALTQDDNHPSYLAARTFAETIMDLATPNHPGSISFEDLENGIKNDLPAGNLRTSLLAVIQSTDKKIEDAQKAIEAWYEDHMDRVSGWYKRKTQLWTLIVATIITVATNADTLHVASRLWLEPTLRSQLVEAARNPPSVPANPGVKSNQVPTASDQAAETLGVVLGWKDTGDLKDVRKWAERIVGWALTILAVSLGAPFWFDVLNRFMNLRSAGNSPSEKGKLQSAAG